MIMRADARSPRNGAEAAEEVRQQNHDAAGWEALRRMALQEADPARDDGRDELARFGLVSESSLDEAHRRPRKPAGRG